MSDLIEINCPRCKHTWRQSLADLEKMYTVYRDDTPPNEAETYRAKCPLCGTYVVITVGEDGSHG
jgi:endogenous inhibitor of DNA gyrase (YacG/DUF329 family)